MTTINDGKKSYEREMRWIARNTPPQQKEVQVLITRKTGILYSYHDKKGEYTVSDEVEHEEAKANPYMVMKQEERSQELHAHSKNTA